MADAVDDVRLSKTLSYWLRHRPAAGSLVLDEQGWADLDAVLAALERTGAGEVREKLGSVVATNDKQRFELSADGSRIRARQGHSVPVRLDWPVRTPPELLYHGTVQRALPTILEEGLRPMRRHHVHLSPDIATARRVGARRGAPVILEIRASELHDTGTLFYLTANNVWLTKAVPPAYLDVIERADQADAAGVRGAV
jgi:putative RNA 2'-phosphotransferase